MKWFRVRTDDGCIVGICEMSGADAQRNLAPGETLVPYSPTVPLHHRWCDGEWVEAEIPPGPASDYRFMRRSGYDVGAQVGALMKVVEAALSLPDLAAAIPAEARAEFDALAAHNAGLKALHPKP